MIRKAIYFVLFLFLIFSFFVYLISEGLLGTYETNRPINTSPQSPDFLIEKAQNYVEAKGDLNIKKEKNIM